MTVQYDEKGAIERIHTVIVAIQHDASLKDRFNGSEEEEHAFVQSEIQREVIEHAIPPQLLDDDCNIIVNGTGRFADPGGPYADAGLTGRKIIVDTYGGMGRHGGGAFSGKDPSKVDRSAAYALRWAAKHVVASGLAERCEIQLGYGIGVAEPVSLRVESFGTSSLSPQELTQRVSSVFDFRPAAIAQILKLNQPIYSITASGGHFGRVPYDDYFPWEQLDDEMVKLLLEA